MKIYLIAHDEIDGDLVEWQCQDNIAFVRKEKAEEFVKTHKELDYYVTEIELFE